MDTDNSLAKCLQCLKDANRMESCADNENFTPVKCPHIPCVNCIKNHMTSEDKKNQLSCCLTDFIGPVYPQDAKSVSIVVQRIAY